MEQLVRWGFPRVLAAGALAATGGDFTKAAEWILSHRSSTQIPATSQAKLDRFLHPNTETLNFDMSEVTSKRRKLSPSSHRQHNQPLSERMRPRTLNEVVGQDHLLLYSSHLRSALESNRRSFILLWGRPGTGKTSIPKSLINSSKDPSLYRFISLSAVTSGVKDVRDTLI